jgi:flavin-binding protein dodecin
MENRVARVTDIVGASSKSFDEAVNNAFKRATKTLRGITGMRILEQRVSVSGNKIKEYRVRMEVIFLLES